MDRWKNDWMNELMEEWMNKTIRRQLDDSMDGREKERVESLKASLGNQNESSTNFYHHAYFRR